MTLSLAQLNALQLPVMAAPMTMASGPELITACCAAGVIGGFQAANARDAETFKRWFGIIRNAQARARDTGSRFAPYVVNLLLAAGRNPVLSEFQLTLCEEGRVPLLLTTGGDPSSVVERAHQWGGRVIHDVPT